MSFDEQSPQLRQTFWEPDPCMSLRGAPHEPILGNSVLGRPPRSLSRRTVADGQFTHHYKLFAAQLLCKDMLTIDAPIFHIVCAVTAIGDEPLPAASSFTTNHLKPSFVERVTAKNNAGAP